MEIHEFQAKNLLRRYQVAVPRGYVASTPVEAEFAMLRLKSELAVVKAQIHAGGRGKAGGVKLVRSVRECHQAAAEMLGKTLVTHQTGPDGKEVHRVYVEEGSDIEKEFYLALLVDRAKQAVAIVASAQGGMDIEEVAKKDASQITTVHVNPLSGIKEFHIQQLVAGLELRGSNLTSQFRTTVKKLYQIFMTHDLLLLEINPLAVVSDKLMVLDTKVTVDSNALFRQEDLANMRDYKAEDEREVEAAKFRLGYIGLDGPIGCLVNGAGLAMATMDIVKYHGGEPSNFLDLGGGASQHQVENAFRIVLRDGRVKGILVNIFGGIMKCDTIANGMVIAVRDLGLNVPLVVRLEGTNVEKGREILRKSEMNIITAVDMADAAKKIIELVKKQELSA